MDIMLQRIADLVGNKHGSKKALADHLNMSQNVITSWFSSNPKMKSESYKKHAPQIAEYFQVSLDYLAGMTNRKVSASDSKITITTADDRLRNEFEDLYRRLTPEQREIVKAAMREMQTGK